MRPPRRPFLRQFAVATVAVGVAVALTLELAAQSVTLTPNQHKALYLFNFAKYTEWPKEAFASDDAPFVLGILKDPTDKDPFGKDIEIINGKTVKGRKLEIRRFLTVEDVQKSDCQLLFIASSETNKLAQILKALEKSNVLTIAEVDGFLQASGMINLLTEKKSAGTQTVAFEVNLLAAQRANLKLDAQLLKLARNVLRT
ncbi:MAG: YfiR family protein [Pedosphaera sp.]|nr:YfiR family protein [Pedosphaera sp.]